MAYNMDKFQVNINGAAVKSIVEFGTAAGGYRNFVKEVSFIRYIGFESEDGYRDEINRLDDHCMQEAARLQKGYLRLDSLEKYIPPDKTDNYLAVYDRLASMPKEEERRMEIAFPFQFENNIWRRALLEAYDCCLELYVSSYKNASASIIRNFGVKLLYWMELYYPKLFLKTRVLANFPKLVYTGEAKLQEYLFLYLTVKMGCDVLYLNPEHDIALTSPEPARLSALHKCAHTAAINMPEPNPFRRAEKIETKAPPIRVDVRHPKREKTSYRPAAEVKPSGKPMEYEELAKFSSSIVMINVYNDGNEGIKSGSGVVINGEGYILTNFHVVSGGSYFGVRLEEESEIYFTREMIKYHPVFDLALLKIERQCRPIPLYNGGRDLARGQKVVAIGSPLGLFNSVSDGIISGFRELEHVSMIQFTAATSHGSSGGALLDLYGSLIGICTAGYDDGQNLNLAVDFKTVKMFAGGFLKS